MDEFKYKGFKFRYDRWNTDDFSSHTRGAIQVYVNEEWRTMVSYEGIEDYAKLSLTSIGYGMEEYTERDNFYFSDDDIIGFLKRNVPNISEYIKKNIVDES